MAVERLGLGRRLVRETGRLLARALLVIESSTITLRDRTRTGGQLGVLGKTGKRAER